MEVQDPPRSTPGRRFSSPRKSLGKKGKGGTDSSNASIASSDNQLQPERSNSSGIRASIDRGLDKLKERSRPGSIAASIDTSSSQTDPSPGRRSKLSNLIHSRSRRKKRKDESESPGHEAGERELGRGRAGIAKSGILLTAEQASPTSLENLGNGSTDSLAASRSGRSSLLTEDSDPEPPTQPHLVSHPSHEHYLTLSSPLVEAETVNSSSLTPEPISSRLGQSISAPPAVTLTDTEDSTSTALIHSVTPDPAVKSASDPAADDQTSITSASSTPSRAGPFAGLFGALNRPESIGSSTAVSSTKAPPPKLRLPANINFISAKGESKSATLPSTFVTPPTPDAAQPSPSLPTLLTQGIATSIRGHQSSASVSSTNSIGHRRVRSALAAPRGISSPLSPAIEEASTPGGTLVHPSGSSGFFSTFFSATQNAVNTLSNALNSPTAGSGSQRSRSGTDPSSETRAPGNSSDGTGEQEAVIVTNKDRAPPPEKEPAIATLGLGNLSLSHLGLSDQDSNTSMSATRVETQEEAAAPAPLPPQPDAIVPNGTRHAHTYPAYEASSAAEAVSAAYAADKPLPDYRVEMGRPYSNSTSTRPRSVASSNGVGSGDATPPRSAAAAELEGALAHRSGSIRSRLSDRKKRSRRSSTATGSAIAAAISSSHASLGIPANSKRFSGFSQASSKRNNEFHQMFKSVPEDDYLIDDYSAALQRDILLHGRLYITERHLCFSSNILGWSTSLVIAIDEIVALEKKSTALIFPNAITIQTLHSKNVLASFINRDNTYDIILALWKIGHPKVKATDNGHVLDNARPDSGSGNGAAADQEESDVDEEEVSDDSDAGSDNGTDDAATNSSLHNKAASIAGSEAGDGAKAANTQRQPSGAANGGAAANGTASKAATEAGNAAGNAGSKDFPGPATHAPTECSDQDSHYDKLCLDTTIPAPLGKVYSLLFGPSSGSFMRKFLIEDQKSGDLQMEDDKKGIGEDAKSFSYTFIKPLGGSIGPKQTKCIVNQTLDAFDLEKAVSVTGSTQTPDVPSGNVFVTKTKYCLSWGPSNSTRLVMNTTCEWSGKSWLKGPIEKGAAEGQEKYGNQLAAYLKAHLSKSSPQKAGKSGKGKGRKKRASNDGEENATSATKSNGSASAEKGGLSGTLSSVFGDVAGSLMTPTGILATLLFVVTVLWVRGAWFSPAAGRATISLDGRPVLSPRFAGYDDLWKREESELWSWLEDRINLDSMTSFPTSSDFESGSSHTRQQVVNSRSMEAKLDEERMNERQLDNAVKVTEERLEALKVAIEKKKMKKTTGTEE